MKIELIKLVFTLTLYLILLSYLPLTCSIILAVKDQCLAQSSQISDQIILDKYCENNEYANFYLNQIGQLVLGKNGKCLSGGDKGDKLSLGSCSGLATVWECEYDEKIRNVKFDKYINSKLHLDFNLDFR